ncbi:uncharacterized protein LOC134275069 [Saccostrea cucullata]|uniref:uncharacterized protein LOC134275069 n=1 Tax=Saccostrea cuccullata TaxID=36930 RepID=UPI002ED1A2DB
MMESEDRLFKATWINPHTYKCRLADFCEFGKRTVTVYVNEEKLGSTHVFIQDRTQCFLDEISDVRSPLHYLKEILDMAQGREEKLHSEMSESMILKATKKLLKTLQEKSIVSNNLETLHSKGEQDSIEVDNTSREEGEVIFRRRPTRQAFKKRSISNKSDLDRDISEEEQRVWIERQRRRSQRISRTLQHVCSKEDFPSIDLNRDLLKSLPSDFFKNLTL